MQTIKENFKSYTEQVPFNNIPCNEGETLVPVVAAGEMKEMLKLRGLDPKNIRSWKFPHAKKVVPVAFIQVRIDEMENAASPVSQTERSLYEQSSSAFSSKEPVYGTDD